MSSRLSGAAAQMPSGHEERGTADLQEEAGKASGWKESSSHGTILIKIGGSTLGHHDTTLQDVVALQRAGGRPVVVHGGGKVINEWMQRQGVRPKFVRGLRVTDKRGLEIVVSVLSGLLNKEIVASIIELGGMAVGLSGVDGGMLEAEVLDPELGLVGRVVSVNPSPIKAAMSSGYIPVIAPIARNSAGAVSGSGPFLNVNADTAAGEIAVAIKAESLVFATDVEGVVDSSRRLIPRLTERQARGLMRSRVIAGGMLPKIGACLMALGEVGASHIIDGRKPHTVRDVLSGKALGTRIG